MPYDMHIAVQARTLLQQLRLQGLTQQPLLQRSESPKAGETH